MKLESALPYLQTKLLSVSLKHFPFPYLIQMIVSMKWAWILLDKDF